ncbi:EAL domain-containing protein [Catenovulum sediminis]|uniref:EAL domain-containing protein n=1 Tax=Catenovulum sediminis TaxID=1740262 RepID=A0ABV1RL38_9ALTE
MKRMQRAIIFASSGVLLLFVLLGLASEQALEKWKQTHQSQLVNSQLQSVDYLFQQHYALSQLKVEQLKQTSDKSLWLDENPSFAMAVGSDLQVLWQIYLTQDNVLATSLPTSFNKNILEFLISEHDSSTGITQLNKNDWALVSIVEANGGQYIYGTLLPSDSLLATPSYVVAETSTPFNLTHHIVLEDLLTQQNVAIPLKIDTNRAFYNQPIIVLAALIFILSLASVVMLLYSRKVSAQQHLNRLQQEVSRIKPNSESERRVGDYQTGEIGALAGSINDMLDELFAAKEFNKVTLNSIGDAVITTDLHGIVTFCNAATFKIIKTTEQEILGKHIADVLPFSDAEDSKRLRRVLKDVIRNGHDSVSAGERYMHRLNRELEILYIEKHITLLRNPEKELVGTVMVLRDMTQSERLRKKLNFQASYDIVTKLLNRHKYEEMLNEAVHNAKMERREHVLCQIDLDRFKLINDSAGHAAGDQLLYEIGGILKSFLRKTDVCARIGGDEYGIILFDAHLEHGLAIFDKILSQIKEYRFIWGGKIHSIGASVGVTIVNSDTHNAAEARREADAACYMAKNVGMNNIRVFDPNNEKLNSHHQAPRWAARINDALVNDKFELFFQRINPTIGVSEREHIEILLRMIDDDGILLAPGMFLPAAERFRLTPKIDRWVIKTVFRWISSRPQLWKKVTLSINLSGESLNDEKLFSYIIDLHEKIGFPPETICFEVTETAAVANLVVGRELIMKLKSHGFTFALDDFGKGFSSYSYLQNLPAEYVKIDGGFVKEMTMNDRDREIVRSIHQISNVMGMKTIAEYVEDDNILDALREIGVDYAQGFGIQKPASLSGFVSLDEALNAESSAINEELRDSLNATPDAFIVEEER